jgi:hypothetical protein
VIALPTIGHELDIKDADLQWLVSAYSLTFGCFLLLAGRLSDLYGHKRVFLVGMAWFSVWSIGCGLAKNEISIVIMRALQGMGGAASIVSAGRDLDGEGNADPEMVRSPPRWELSPTHFLLVLPRARHLLRSALEPRSAEGEAWSLRCLSRGWLTSLFRFF